MRLRYFIFLFCLVNAWAADAQYYAFAGYSHHFVKMPAMQRISDEFNLRESHTLQPFKSMNGYRFGFGSYGRWTMVELSYGNDSRLKKSTNPNQLKENAELRVNFAAVQFNLGFRPIARQYLILGAGLNLAQQRVRYSFGGDYTTPLLTYTIVPEFFIDYGIKIRFLAKRAERDKIFYLLRLRPSYQFHAKTDLQAVEQQFNGNAAAPTKEWVDNWSNFGFQVTLAVPFGRDIEELAKKRPVEKKTKTPKEGGKGGRD